MKTKNLILLLSIVYASCCWAQPNHLAFNTAVTNSPYTSVIPMYSPDNLWSASLNLNFGYGAAIHVPQVSGWAFPGSNHAWICYPFSCTPGDPADHGGGLICSPGAQDVFYEAVFTLTNTTYVLDLEIWGDDRVETIYVNGIVEYANTYPTGYQGYWNSMNFKKCNGWRIGTNSLKIRTRSYATNMQGYINHTGLMVKSTPPQAVTISTNSPICINSPANFFASGVTGATSYNWIYTPAFSGGASGQYVTPTAPGSVGTATVKVIASGTAGCLAYNTMTVNIISTTVTASASSPTMCAGGSVTLTATGNAANYYWVPPVGSIIAGNPVVITTPGTYTVLGLGPCTGTNVITINPGPTVLPVVGTATTCSNMPNGVQIGATSSFPGTVSYSWTWPPSGSASGQYAMVYPTVNTNYVVTASSPGNGCPGTATLAVTVLTNCCTQFTVPGMTVLNSNVIPTGSSLSGQFIINQNTTLGTTPGLLNFNDASFLIAPGVVLTIPQGNQVAASGVHFYGCDNTMWKGIVIQDGGFFQAFYNQNNVTLIEDAVAGIEINNYSGIYNPPIELNGTIFNKNYTSIKVTNSNQAYVPLIVRSCVFTSRNLPFTATSWPNSYTTPGGLREEVVPGATLGLAVPFDLQGHSPANLKIPYNTQPANIGVEIRNIGNTVGSAPTNGVDVGYTNQVPNGFNLFDGLGIGIDVTDASMSTMNNVFQNMLYFSTPNGMFGGKGIRHNINASSLMNARLNLSPMGSLYQNTNYGNRFWNCYDGVNAKYIYDFSAEYAIIRSDHQSTNTSYGPGAMGIILESNRFQYLIKNSEFNNLNYGIWLNTNSDNYDVNGNTGNGIYASGIDIKENYFGAQVNSTLAVTAEYLGDAIHVNTMNSNNWQYMGSGSIQSNKIDKAYRGITINGMDTYPFNVSGNIINLTDDNTFGQPQYGIEALSVQGPLFIMSNTLSATGPANPLTTLVHCFNTVRPNLECNDLSNSFQAFEFEGSNPNTNWAGNLMQNHERGLVLSANGYIDPQGAPGSPHDNQWLGAWTLPSYETYVSGGSNASASPLFVQSGAPFEPFGNGSGGGTPYNSSNIIITSPGFFACKILNLPPPPSQRTANLNAVGNNNKKMTWDVALFPNPSSGNLTIVGLQENETSTIKITDVTGKVVYSQKTVTTTNDIDLSSLANGIYLVEIQGGINKVVKKLVLSK